MNERNKTQYIHQLNERMRILKERQVKVLDRMAEIVNRLKELEKIKQKLYSKK